MKLSSSRSVGTTRANVARVLTSSVGSAIINGVLGILVLPKVLHGLDVSRYGEWATLTAVIVVGQLCTIGVSTEVSRRIAAANGLGDSDGVARAVAEGTTVLFAFACVIELLGIVLAHPIVNLVFSSVASGQRGQLSLLLTMSVTLVAISLAGASYFGVLSNLQRADFANWSGIGGVVVSAIATVAGVAAGLGLWALMVADYLQVAVSWSGVYVGIRRLVPHVRLRLTRVSRALVFALIAAPGMVVLASASDLFDLQVDKLVLTHQVGPAASGMFQIGVTLVTAAKGVALIPLGVLFAGTAELHLTQPERLRRLEFFAGSTAQAIAAIAAGGFLVFSPTFLRVWLGPGYSQAAFAMRILGIAVLLNMWSAPWIFYATGRGRYGYVMAAASATVIANAVFTILATSRIGLPGAVFGSIAGSVAGTGTGWFILRRWERRPWLRPALRATLVVAPAVAAFFALSRHVPSSWFGLGAWAVAYVVACGILLMLTRSLPVRFEWEKSGSMPRVRLRECAPAEPSGEPKESAG